MPILKLNLEELNPLNNSFILSNQVPLFEGTEIGFLKMLSMRVRPVYFLAKEYVVRKGDIGQEVRNV